MTHAELAARLREANENPASVKSWRDLVAEAAAAIEELARDARRYRLAVVVMLAQAYKNDWFEGDEIQERIYALLKKTELPQAGQSIQQVVEDALLSLETAAIDAAREPKP